MTMRKMDVIRKSIRDKLLEKRRHSDGFRLYGVPLSEMTKEEMKGAIGYLLANPEISAIHSVSREPGRGPFKSITVEEDSVVEVPVETVEELEKDIAWTVSTGLKCLGAFLLIATTSAVAYVVMDVLELLK